MQPAWFTHMPLLYVYAVYDNLPFYNTQELVLRLFSWYKKKTQKQKENSYM